MRIAITGIGIVSALGIGKEANRDQLLAHTSHVSAARILPTTHGEWPVGEVGLTNEELAAKAGKIAQGVASRNILLGLLAASEALTDAKLLPEMKASMPLINGTTVGGMDQTERYYPLWKAGDYSSIDAIYSHEAGKTAETIAEKLGMTQSTTVSTACSSALNAMIHAAGLIRTGKANRVMAGGTEALTLFHANGFSSLGILSNTICKPFADDRDGINLGEGAAYLVLENADEAEKRGAHIYGYLAGYANRCDAYHQTASSPEGDGAYDAMSRALEMSGLRSDEIAYLNAHGTATPNNDASEMQAIRRVFGTHLPIIESTKPLTGHTTSASGSIEVIFSLLKMHQEGYAAAMSNAFGFGGNDSSVVLTTDPADLPAIEHDISIEELSEVTADADVDYKPYIPAMQARRMTPVMRRLIVAAKEALAAAEIACPDAIIVATHWGGMIPSAQLLMHLADEGEQNMSPAQFMSSTHNSAAGTLARLLQCKGYNSTISHGAGSWASAIEDARLLLLTSEAKNVMVCAFDEVADGWQNHLEKAGIPASDVAKVELLVSNN